MWRVKKACGWPVRTPASFIVLLALSAWGFLPGSAVADVVVLSPEEIVHRSGSIVVGTVTHAVARYNEQGTLIVTDYRVEVDEVLGGNARESLEVTVLGGTLDGETHHTTLTTPLEVGARYLLFLEPSLSLSPFTGAWQGVVRELEGTDGVSRPVVGPSLQPVAEGLDFAALVEQIRRLVDAVAADPPPARQPGDDDQNLPSKRWSGAVGGDESLGGEESLGGVEASPGETAERPHFSPSVQAASGFGTPPLPADQRLRPGDPEGELRTALSSSKYYIERWPSRPVIFDPFPLDWYWSPYDQYMMSRWNVYRSELFRVWDPPSGTWAWANGIFELAGWPSDADMIQQFGSPWGANTLGVTYSRWTTGPIIEADIALNPAFAWTLDNEYATRPNNSVHGFEQTMLHELGHAFGLKHPWDHQDVWWDSVMNYAPKSFRHPQVHADDANAVRAAYPGIAIHDVMVTFHETTDFSGSTNPLYSGGYPWPNAVEPGGTFTIYDLALQNVGTDNIVEPRVEIYLTDQRQSWSDIVYLETQTQFLTIAPFTTYYFTAWSVDVPQGTAPGVYYLGLFVRDDGDGFQNNNSAWSGYYDTLTVLAVTDLQAGGSAGPYALIPGQEIDVSATVSNSGNVASASTQLHYLLSSDPVIDGSDTLLATVDLDGLAPGGQVFDSRTLAGPSAVGDYFVGVCVDAVSGESDLADNCSAGSAVVVSTPNDQPLSNGVPREDVLDADVRFGAWDFFYFDVEAGDLVDVRFLELPASYPQDLDLYLRFGDRPTLSEWDCRPYVGGATLESCRRMAPATGRMWVGVTNWDLGTIPYQLGATWETLLFGDGFESGGLGSWAEVFP